MEQISSKLLTMPRHLKIDMMKATHKVMLTEVQERIGAVTYDRV